MTGPWKILIVDDAPDARQSAVWALLGLRFKGWPLQILEADSFESTCAVLAEHKDIAVILLDVVMETTDAGLRLVQHIRTQMGNSAVRIILRTGQAGYAPEQAVIRDYEIDDYVPKHGTEKVRLVTSVVTALRTYDLIERNQRMLAGVRGALACSQELLSCYGPVGIGQTIAGHAGQIFGDDCTAHVAEVGDPADPGSVVVLGQLPQSPPLITPTIPDAGLGLLLQCAKTGANLRSEQSRCERLQTAGGRLVLLLHRAAGFDETDDQMLSMLVLTASMTLSRMEATTNRLQNARDTLTVMANDLKTPLAALRNGMLYMESAHGAQSLDWGRMRSIMDNDRLILNRIGIYLNTALANAKAAAGGELELRKEVVNVELMAQDIAELYRPGFTRISKILVSANGDCNALADPAALEVVLLNLLTNADKAIAPGAPDDFSSVGIVVWREGDQVILDVNDRGCGIEPERLKRIFGPQERSAEGRASQGLGLAMVRKSVRLMGGDVTIESTLGQGTGVSLRLPAAYPADS